jgi:hypothetical protein
MSPEVERQDGSRSLNMALFAYYEKGKKAAEGSQSEF